MTDGQYDKPEPKGAAANSVPSRPPVAARYAAPPPHAAENFLVNNGVKMTPVWPEFYLHRLNNPVEHVETIKTPESQAVIEKMVASQSQLKPPDPGRLGRIRDAVLAHRRKLGLTPGVNLNGIRTAPAPVDYEKANAEANRNLAELAKLKWNKKR